MYRILEKRTLAPRVNEYVIEAKEVAQHARPGQFIILRVDEKGERIPFTICDYDKSNGTVTILVQEVGYSTAALSKVPKGGCIADFVGPLGKPTDLSGYNKIVLVGGGIGSAVIYPQAKKLFAAGITCDVIVGARTRELIMYEEQFRENCRELILTTDDGSYGRHGNVCVPLEEMFAAGEKFDKVITIGPLIMMKFVVAAVRPTGIPCDVSMNPIMIDGTGMCGGCRLIVGGQTKFACVDGPDFDGYEVDFDSAMERGTMYRDFERHKHEETCNLFKKAEN